MAAKARPIRKKNLKGKQLGSGRAEKNSLEPSFEQKRMEIEIYGGRDRGKPYLLRILWGKYKGGVAVLNFKRWSFAGVRDGSSIKPFLQKGMEGSS